MEKRVSESKRAHQALCDYAYLGPARGIRQLHRVYEEQAAKAKDAPGAPIPPTVKLSTLWGWSVTHEWQARVEAWDKQQAEEGERVVKAARLRLALGADDAAKALVDLLTSEDEAQKRLAAGDLLDRVGVAKGVRVEVELPPIRYIEVGGGEDDEGAG